MDKQRVKDEKRVDPRLIHQYLLDKGLSEEHALGMMANMKAESNFIAGRKEEGGGSGIGLFQHSGVRKPKMLAAINNDLQNWKGQIDFALSEADTKNYISKKFSSPEEATIWFMKNWERPADQSAAKQQERIDRFFIGYDKGNYNANYKIPTDSASYTTTPTDLPTNTPDQLRITTLEEQNKQLAEDFKKAHEDLAQKEKLEKESSTVKELTKAEQDQQNRAKFWEAYSAPQEDVAQETPQALPSANDLGLYTQNLGFDVQQAGQLFSTGQPAQQTFAEGGPVNNSIVSNIENGQVDTDAMNAMMKSRMAISAEFGNPAAQRMTSPNPKTYTFTGEEGTDAPIGSQGTHFMASMGEYAVPLLQDKGGNELEYNENPRPSSEDMKFRTPEEAQYFAEHYKEIAPMMRTFAEGGKTGKPENYKILPETFNYEGRPGARYRRDNYGNWLVADKNTDGKFVAVKDASGERQAELNRRAVSSETGKTANEYDKKQMESFTRQMEANTKALHGKDYGPQSAGSADWFWTLPILGPAALEAAGSVGAMSLPGMASVPGATVGNLANAAAIGHGITQTPETIKAWDDVVKGKKKWQDAALETGINLSEFAGSGSGVKYLADDVVQGSKYLGKTLGTETGLLSNAYKINPNRYTVPDNTYVRQIMNTDEGVGKQLVESLGSEGKVLSPHQLGLTPEERASHWFQHVQNPIEQTMELPNQGLVDLKKADNLGDLPFFQKERLYYGNSRDVPKKSILIESKPALSSDNFTTAAIKHTYYPRNPNDLQLLDEFIGGKVVLNNPFDAANVENFNIYEPHWWKGYKQTGFRDGGTQESLLDQNSIDAFKQKYGI